MIVRYTNKNLNVKATLFPGLNKESNQEKRQKKKK
jgi:hypothetical protein